MKIWVPNELIFTVFFKRENAVKYIKDVFINVYGEIDEMLTNEPPVVVYNKNKDNINLQWN